MTTPSEAVRVAVQEALDLSKFAAAPFFGSQVRQRDDDGEVSYIWATTPEWWAGLQELIERVQPMLQDALAALSLHVGDAADTDTGASASPTACSGPSAPEPLSVSALRVPPAGAQAGGVGRVNWAREAYDKVMTHAGRVLDTSPDLYGVTLSFFETRDLANWLAALARGMEARQGRDPQGLDGEATTARPEGARLEAHVTPGYVVTGGHFVESRAQPSPGERHALPRLQVPADEGLDTNERDGKRQETPLTDLREVPTDQRPAAPPGAQEQAGVAQPSLHIEPVAEVFQSGPGAYQIRFLTELPVGTKLYASPTTPTEGLLTDEEIEELWSAWLCGPSDAISTFARAIESKVRASTLTDPEGAS